jgi:murein tripeptide amidase MpaA
MVLRRLLLGFTFALLAPAGTAAAQELSTVAERSGFLKTGRYDEVVTLCTRFAARYPDAVRCETFGTTPEGRPMKALAASRSGALDAAAARARGLPVLLVQGGIHAGEIDGKDAGFWLLRQLLDGEAAPGALDAMVLVFVPVFNVDGHERFGRWNRPNQNGPEEMGWRTTAQNYNLNRDYLKADTPEMQAMLQLVEAWDPIVTMDLHVTNGAKFEHDISVQVEPLNAGDAAQRQQGLALRSALLA